MKNTLILALSAFAFAACQQPKAETEEAVTVDTVASTGSFGMQINEDGAITMDSLVSMYNAGMLPMEGLKVEGAISECCQKKGCWMSIRREDGKTMRVSFKDYGFFVPKNAGGYTAIMQGKAYVDTTSVEDLRHFAQDAEVSEDSLAKITEPLLELTFEAEGVIIR
ncbi:MAG: DUF4920 domain-containing protein [Sphingobacteriales bacterium]|jgi:hypothetical protein|nr:DUF4920 domain-containing protein [Sphingobacteriales bacterium]